MDFQAQPANRPGLTVHGQDHISSQCQRTPKRNRHRTHRAAAPTFVSEGFFYPGLIFNRSPPAGGGERDRTDDLLLAKQALSQLSYAPGRSNGGPGKT